MANRKPLVEVQRNWVRKRYGEDVAARLQIVESSRDSHVISAIAGESLDVNQRGHVFSIRYSGESPRHTLVVGKRVPPHGEWAYPDWVTMPRPLARLVEPGKLVLKANGHGRPGGRSHLFCQCRVESSRGKVAGNSPKRFAQYQLRCVDEECTYPEKYFSFSDSMANRNSQARLIELPVTLEAIKTEFNTEVRRRLIAHYGVENYLRDAEATLVSQDDWGKLWWLAQPGDEPIVMVEMVNSTPEPDGSYSTYWERVPPTTRTPLEGLAWQANVTPAVYAQMEVQT